MATRRDTPRPWPEGPWSERGVSVRDHIQHLHDAGFVVTSGGFPQYEAAVRAAQADATRRLWGEAAGGWEVGRAAGLTEDEAIAAELELEGPDLEMGW